MSGHRRHFVTIGERQVHFRWAGDGPPVVLLHACPKSSLEQAPLVERLSARFSAFAFDLPGYGDSDPLPLDRPEIADFADAFAETLDALGIDRTAAYGRHTGGLVVLELARRHPGRVTRAVLDGFPVFADDERRRFLAGYLEPLLPRWDGLHLPGLWARMRENYLFFPWNEGPEPAHRNVLDMPPATQLHATAIDLLKVMDLWRVGYASAFRYRPQEALAQIDTPTLVMARRDDLLFPHLERLPPLPASVTVEPHSYDVDRWAGRIESFLAEGAGAGGVVRPTPTQPRSSRPWSAIVDTPAGPLRLRTFGEGPRDLLLLHDLPGSSAIETPLARALGEEARIVVPDLPGVGLSRRLADGASGGDLLGGLAWLAREHLRPGAMLAARGLSARIALALAARPGPATPLLLLRPLLAPREEADGFAGRYAPPVAPDTAGTHLTRLWYLARDGELYFPWFDPTREAIRGGERRLDPAHLTDKVVAMAEDLDGYRALVHAALAADDAAAPGGVVAPVVLHDADRIGTEHARMAAERLPGAERSAVPPSTEAEIDRLRIWIRRADAR